MKKISLMVAFVLVGLSACGPKQTANQEQKKAGISVENQWVREVPPVNKSSAAYLTIVNNTDEEAVLVDGGNDVSNVTEIHEMVMDGDTMRMKRIDSLSIPPRGSFELKPGGLHIMLIDLKKELKAGDVVNMTLNFKDGRNVSFQAEVKKPEAEEY